MSLAADDQRHGTVTGYQNHRCRCADCRRAIADYMRPRNKAWRHRTGRNKPRATWLSDVEPPHGTEGRYTSPRFKCRCEDCKRASREARARRRKATA